MEELEVDWEQVVDLEDHRADEQHDEPVVDHRVHHASSWILKDSAHGNTVEKAAQATFVLAGTGLPCAALPVPCPFGKQPDRHSNEGGHGHVEQCNDEFGDIAEDDPANLELRLFRERSEPPQRKRADNSETSENTESLRCC